MHLSSRNATRRSAPPKLVVREGNRYSIHKRGDAQEKKEENFYDNGDRKLQNKSYQVRIPPPVQIEVGGQKILGISISKGKNGKRFPNAFDHVETCGN